MQKKKKLVRNEPAHMQSADAPGMIDTDPLGSYTGIPDNPYEKPVQDADDL
ncbi:MAG: hypothetical protein IJY20_08255 [Clostridia bacterium]|nr:hypothetical protein [Clostridia bacterium]